MSLILSTKIPIQRSVRNLDSSTLKIVGNHPKHDLFSCQRAIRDKDKAELTRNMRIQGLRDTETRKPGFNHSFQLSVFGAGTYKQKDSIPYLCWTPATPWFMRYPGICTHFQKVSKIPRKQTYGYQGGERGGMNWEIGIDIYTLLCTTQIREPTA